MFGRGWRAVGLPGRGQRAVVEFVRPVVTGPFVSASPADAPGPRNETANERPSANTRGDANQTAEDTHASYWTIA